MFTRLGVDSIVSVPFLSTALDARPTEQRGERTPTTSAEKR